MEFRCYGKIWKLKDYIIHTYVKELFIITKNNDSIRIIRHSTEVINCK